MSNASNTYILTWNSEIAQRYDETLNARLQAAIDATSGQIVLVTGGLDFTKESVDNVLTVVLDTFVRAQHLARQIATLVGQPVTWANEADVTGGTEMPRPTPTLPEQYHRLVIEVASMADVVDRAEVIDASTSRALNSFRDTFEQARAYRRDEAAQNQVLGLEVTAP